MSDLPDGKRGSELGKVIKTTDGRTGSGKIGQKD